MSVRNVVGFIWAIFSGIITLRVLNPLYNIIFGLTWDNNMLMYAMQFVFAVFIFAVCFFIPFRTFTEFADERGYDID